MHTSGNERPDRAQRADRGTYAEVRGAATLVAAPPARDYYWPTRVILNAQRISIGERRRFDELLATVVR
jgi:hypothetical protein